MSFSIPKEQLKGINYKQITKTKHKDNIKAAKETKTEETSFAKEEFISTGQAEQIINPKSADFNSEILSKLESFAQDNPLWMSFMEGLTAGILAGKAAKNAELSKEVAA